MTETLLVRIILPSKIVLEMQAYLVNIPSNDGVFGILPKHAKLTSSIDIGVIVLFSKEKQVQYFIHSGIAQVTGAEVNILSEFAVDLAEESTTSVHEKITALESNLLDVQVDAIATNIISDNIKIYKTLLNFI